MKPDEHISQQQADAILRTLVAHEVEFVVIGGLAVAAHGYIRGTNDVDIVPDPRRENLERLFDALNSIGARPIEQGDFRPEEMPVQFDPDGLTFGGNWALLTTHGRIDLLQWAAGFEGYDQLRENALSATLPTIGTLLFAGYDDLVSMKTAANRPEDRIDLQRLREARGES